MKSKLFRNVIILCLLFNFSLSFSQIKIINDSIFKLDTDNISYIIRIQDGKLQTGYYGSKIKSHDLPNIYFEWRDEVPVRGRFPNKSPILEVVFSDGTRDLDLEYVSHKITSNDGFNVLTITNKDKYYDLLVNIIYRVLPEYDIIEKHLELKNTGKELIKIENAMSASLWLPQGAYEVTHMQGIHWHDFQPETTLLTQGVKSFMSRDFKTYGSSYFAVRPQGEICEDKGDVWYGQLHYSGNWKTDLESTYDDRVQITSGINFWDTEWNLRNNETFKTPVLSFGYAQNGSDEVARRYSNYTRDLIIPQQRSKIERPVIYNSWYATEFNINETQQLELAQVAKKIGVEMFVIDDGWFKGRVNDKAGLGDWTVDKGKFPNGLTPLIKKINDLGLDFGIWVEPEMVNRNSDLYRKHPDWVLHFENRPRTEGRNQLMLNLAREDVYDYLYNELYNLLKGHNIKYLKWDMNKSLSEPGWPDTNVEEQREVRIRYIDNLYKLISRLTSDFPEVWFETCSSGGGRVDLGIFNWADFAWVSDNIDPVDRIFIQYGYLNAFPANTMISWTGYYDNHGVKPGMDFRFDVAMSGVLGIGNDITKWDVNEIDLAKTKITEYKNIRKTIHNGYLYRISSPFKSNRSILQYNDKLENADRAVIFFYQLDNQLKGSTAYPYQNKYIKLKGLQEDALYRIDNGSQLIMGADLMNIGILYPLTKSYTSKIIILEKI
ncbi:Alpha-galactosidase AgaA [anaerobic digester metagenome]|jgi:alpha-galactosidase